MKTISNSLPRLKEFLEKFGIDEKDFKKTKLKFDELEAIKHDYESKWQMYDDAGANLVRILLRFSSVHSMKYRIKDGEHLIEKIIRKKIDNPDLDISVNNYQEKIQDLIGIRIMHLFKSDWRSIHEKLLANFKMMTDPEANIRKGDIEEDFKEAGCKIKLHKAGYRSVHYIIKTEPTLQTLLAEIQVRTILEEAWSEVDHKIRYPYNLNNSLINQYLQIFNRLAGGADEMADYVLLLNKEMLAKEVLISEQVLEIKKLKEQLDHSSALPAEKVSMNKSIEAVEKSTGSIYSTTWYDHFKSFDSQSFDKKALARLINSSEAINDQIVKFRQATKETPDWDKLINELPKEE